MKHFQPLEQCRCGAYQYLAAREHAKSFEVVLIHQMPKGERKYLKVASFKKAVLDFHQPRNRGLRGEDALAEAYREARADILRMGTLLGKRTKPRKETTSQAQAPRLGAKRRRRPKGDRGGLVSQGPKPPSDIKADKDTEELERAIEQVSRSGGKSGLLVRPGQVRAP